MPIKAYNYSDNRTIGVKIHLIILTDEDALTYMRYLRAIQSAVYPREPINQSGARGFNRPYMPPPICQLKFGNILSKNSLCAVLKSYNLSYPTDVAWYTMPNKDTPWLPFKFDIDCSFDEVRPSEKLPGQESILKDF